MARNRIAIEMDLQRRKQSLLSEGTDKDAKTVYNWMKNIHQPNIFDFKKIADLLGKTMEELIED